MPPRKYNWLHGYIFLPCCVQCKPVMTCYKLVTIDFKWWGVQNRIEAFCMTTEARLFGRFHRLVSGGDKTPDSVPHATSNSR